MTPAHLINRRKLTSPTADVSESGHADEPDRTSAHDLRDIVVHLADSARESSNAQLAGAAATIADLLMAAAIFSEDAATSARAEELLEFVRTEAMPALSESRSNDQLQSLAQHVEDCWGDCLQMLAPEERYTSTGTSPWHDPAINSWDFSEDLAAEDMSAPEDRTSLPDSTDLQHILSSVILSVLPSDVTTQRISRPAQTAETSPHSERPRLPRPPVDTATIDDPELVAAFADDAQLCLAEMEASLLNIESGRMTADGMNNFCRQLHTLKGASGTVGLSELAAYLHEVESWIEAASGDDVNVDQLLECIDTVRGQLEALGVNETTAPISSPPAPPVAGHAAGIDAVKVRQAGTDSESDVFVRVEASRLERLMDLLAELVMLRNHRETHVESLKTIHKELNLCASRSRTLRTLIDFPEQGSQGKDIGVRAESRSHVVSDRFLSQSMSELAGDTAELSRSLHEVFEPLSRNNAAVSHLIGCFRQELMELRRLPVAGLFQRLQRAIHEAARAEGKQVEIRIEGQGARAERGLQQRLFEPLLHLVRNAVSHGIQSAGERIRNGKPEAGRITLSAWSDAATLTLEVRDDGQGLNEAAIESRGRELGLLSPGEAVTSSQLRQLIFHSGFSTRSSVSEISGRGVGMDVVDHWVRRLRGRIEVESSPGIGTAFRLRIPLRSAVEHAMIVRAGGQLFALPMHTIGGTSDAKLPMNDFRLTPETEAVPLNRLLRLPTTQNVRTCLVTLRGTESQTESSANSRRDGLTIAVDEIAGVEEVVVRPLPPLLQRNELFAGVTLSGRAETVLVLDTGRLLELESRSGSPHQRSRQWDSTRRPENRSIETGRNSDHTSEPQDVHCILIVDDSVVVRRGLARRLNSAGYRTQEAGDGQAALKLLRGSRISAVVSDIDMPEMNGVELLQEMRRQKQLCRIPVAILSSRDKQSMPPEISLLQPDAVLTKPITDETIRAILSTLTEAGVRNSSQPFCLNTH